MYITKVLSTSPFKVWENFSQPIVPRTIVASLLPNTAACRLRWQHSYMEGGGLVSWHGVKHKKRSSLTTFRWPIFLCFRTKKIPQLEFVFPLHHLSCTPLSQHLSWQRTNEYVCWICYRNAHSFGKRIHGMMNDVSLMT